MISFRVRRKDELFRKLRRAAPAADEELQKAGRQSAEEMAALAISFAPEDSGDLKESIEVTPPGQRTPEYSQGGAVVPAGAFAVTAGNRDVRYPHFPEYGTRQFIAGGMFEGAQHPGTPRQPYFWPAYRIVRRKHKGRASRALGKAVKRAFGVGGGAGA